LLANKVEKHDTAKNEKSMGCQSAKPKHLLGKKNNNSPWVWGLRPQTQGELLIFFAQKMLSLALHDRMQRSRVT